MAGYKIQCYLKDDTDDPARIMLSIPKAVTFFDLHKLMQIIFSWEDEEGVHEFTAGEMNVPVSFIQDDHEREMKESDLAIDRILEEKEPITYHFFTPEEVFEVEITMQGRLSNYRKSVATCTFAEGILTLEEDEETLHVITAEEFTEMLKETELLCFGSSAPTMDDLLQNAEDHLEDQLKDLGLDMGTMFKKLEEKEKNSTYIPDAPKSTGESKAFRNYIDLKNDVTSRENASYTLKLSDQTMEELLLRFNSTEIFDICKYVQEMDSLGKSDKEEAHAIAEAFKKNPSLLLYSLAEEDMEFFLSIPSLAEKGETAEYSPALGELLAFSLGIFDGKGSILVAKDLGSCLKKVTKSNLTEVKRLCEKYDEGFNILMRNYGVIEFTAIRDLMNKHFSVSLPQKQTNQIIYIRYSHESYIRTLYFDHRDLYAASMEMDIEKLMKNLCLGMADFYPYAELGNREIELWKNANPMEFTEVYPGWSYLNAFLVIEGKIPQEKANEYMTILYIKVRNGETLQQIMQFFQLQNQGTDLYFRLRLWEICLHFVAGTGIPGLKGASRAQACRDPRYQMSLATIFVENPVREEEIEKDTHIDVFPSLLQLQIGGILFTLEETYLPALRRIGRSISNNIDYQFILGSAYQRLGHFSEAIEVFEKLKGRMDTAKDESVDLALRMCRNEDMNRPMALYLDGMLKM